MKNENIESPEIIKVGDTVKIHMSESPLKDSNIIANTGKVDRIQDDGMYLVNGYWWHRKELTIVASPNVQEGKHMSIIDQVRTQVEDCHDYVSEFFLKVAGDFTGKNPYVEVQDFTNSETRLSGLKLNDTTEAFVIEKRTELNHVEFTFIGRQSQHTYSEQEVKWIRVEDEDGILPPFEVKQLIFLENGTMHTGYFNGVDTNGYVWFCDNNDYHYPTHWQPLPNPPKN